MEPVANIYSNYLNLMKKLINPGFSMVMLLMLAISMPVAADFMAGGNAYKRGDYETAVKEFIPAAENGDHRAMYALGSMYAAGRGVKRDLQEAFKWFSKAAQYGRPDAEFKLGIMYADGLGVERNYETACSWFEKAAKKGYPQAQRWYGYMYLQGHGVKQDYVQAYAWSKVAMKLDDRKAQAIVDEARKKLSTEQLAEAESLANEYLQNYSSSTQLP